LNAHPQAKDHEMTQRGNKNDVDHRAERHARHMRAKKRIRSNRRVERRLQRARMISPEFIDDLGTDIYRAYGE
jgi:hypothetical protein